MPSETGTCHALRICMNMSNMLYNIFKSIIILVILYMYCIYVYLLWQQTYSKATTWSTLITIQRQLHTKALSCPSLVLHAQTMTMHWLKPQVLTGSSLLKIQNPGKGQGKQGWKHLQHTLLYFQVRYYTVVRQLSACWGLLSYWLSRSSLHWERLRCCGWQE